MAKGKGGRPRKEDGDQGTRHVRVFNDLADMVGWIHFFTGESVAQILDPMLRGPLVKQYADYEPRAEAIKKAGGQVPGSKSRRKPPPPKA